MDENLPPAPNQAPPAVNYSDEAPDGVVRPMGVEEATRAHTAQVLHANEMTVPESHGISTGTTFRPEAPQMGQVAVDAQVEVPAESSHQSNLGMNISPTSPDAGGPIGMDPNGGGTPQPTDTGKPPHHGLFGFLHRNGK